MLHLKSILLNLCMSHHCMEALLKHRLLGPIPELLIQQVWGGAKQLVYLTNSWALMSMLVRGPHFENRGHILHFCVIYQVPQSFVSLCTQTFKISIYCQESCACLSLQDRLSSLHPTADPKGAQSQLWPLSLQLGTHLPMQRSAGKHTCLNDQGSLLDSQPWSVFPYSPSIFFASSPGPPEQKVTSTPEPSQGSQQAWARGIRQCCDDCSDLGLRKHRSV